MRVVEMYDKHSNWSVFLTRHVLVFAAAFGDIDGCAKAFSPDALTRAISTPRFAPSRFDMHTHTHAAGKAKARTPFPPRCWQAHAAQAFLLRPRIQHVDVFTPGTTISGTMKRFHARVVFVGVPRCIYVTIYLFRLDKRCVWM
jgi:hypothetical protein